jgi:maintenance of mitochondrial morphology protein 1
MTLTKVHQPHQGFLFGQLIIIISIFFLIKFFLLKSSGDSLKLKPAEKCQIKQQKLTSSFILTKLGYTQAHPFESCDFLNVLIAQLISHYRQNHVWMKLVVKKIDELVNGQQRPSFVVSLI